MHHQDRNAHSAGFTCAPSARDALPCRTFDGLRLVRWLAFGAAFAVAARWTVHVLAASGML